MTAELRQNCRMFGNSAARSPPAWYVDASFVLAVAAPGSVKRLAGLKEMDVDLTWSCGVQKASYHHYCRVCQLPKDALLLHFFRQRIAISGSYLPVREPLPLRTAFQIHLSKAGCQDSRNKVASEFYWTVVYHHSHNIEQGDQLVR